MALSRQNVEKAIKILKEIEPRASTKEAETLEEVKQKGEGIICCDKKSDGGYENVFLQLSELTHTQKNEFERRKKEVGNTSFEQQTDYYLQIGWF